MPNCYSCGARVEIRYVGGVVTPIHEGGTCARDTGLGDPRWCPTSFQEDFCRPTACTYCGARIFFIRHNGGSVWIEELRWPWPKHKCYYRDDSGKSNPSGLPRGKAGRELPLGLVIWGASVDRSSFELFVKRQDGKIFRFAVKGDRSHLVGEIIGIETIDKFLTHRDRVIPYYSGVDIA